MLMTPASPGNAPLKRWLCRFAVVAGCLAALCSAPVQAQSAYTQTRHPVVRCTACSGLIRCSAWITFTAFLLRCARMARRCLWRRCLPPTAPRG